MLFECNTVGVFSFGFAATAPPGLLGLSLSVFCVVFCLSRSGITVFA